MIEMSLKEQLLQDLKAAMKEKDIIKKNTVQSIRTGVLQIEKDKQIELDDDGVLDVIARELKKRRDSLPDYEKSGREDLIEGLKGEISVLLSYLPKQLTEEEIAGIVEETIKELGASSMKDMGKVMAAITPKVKGRADNKIVSALVKEKLK